MVSIDSKVIEFRNLIALKLLSHAPEKMLIQTLADNSARELTSDDLPVIELMLEAFDLILDHSVNAVRINGSETNIRRAMRLILQDFQSKLDVDPDQLIAEYPSLPAPAQAQLLAQVNEIKIAQPQLSNHSLNYLTTELFILYCRYSQGEPSPYQLNQIFTSGQLAMIQGNQPIFTLAQSLVAGVSKAVKTELNEIESYYLMLKIWLSVQN
ncbi:BglG family transcription antiterminator [Paucilactobacillus wasatchensis]|uniref:Uncharacterized protein n=1 Tax=Paucilactobacillus wasatchensis TaxID=1335616 RepID=A0A0D1A8G7_9LACO|nr:hypothetical protein [Paucilactobacillus wasatchensis]KIS03056.1 hypothetical protein WDC_1351 [Paucilactobacillus wasatchensis]